MNWSASSRARTRSGALFDAARWACIVTLCGFPGSGAATANEDPESDPATVTVEITVYHVKPGQFVLDACVGEQLQPCPSPAPPSPQPGAREAAGAPAAPIWPATEEASQR